MKKITRYILVSLMTIIMVGLYSCTETSHNGKLDGMWHLVSVDTLSLDTLSTSRTQDLSGDMIYWSFEFKLLELDDKSGKYPNVLFRFDKVDRTLRLYEPYLYNRESGDVPITEINYLLPFGVESTDVTYNIEVLTSSRMILVSPTLRLNFKKF